MALTLAQLKAVDDRRRALAVPPAPEPLPPVRATPSPLYVQTDQPTDVVAGSVWVPLDTDLSPLPIDEWQVLT